MPKINRTNKTSPSSFRQKVDPKSTGNFYRSTIWRRLRGVFIADNPMCVACKVNNIDQKARVIDHVIRIKDGGAKLDKRNLLSLCHRCHNKKSGREKHKPIKISVTKNHLYELIPENKYEVLSFFKSKAIFDEE